MLRESIDLIRRGVRKPPHVLARRLLAELSAEADRFGAPRRSRLFDAHALLRATVAPDLETLWTRLATRPFPATTGRVNHDDYERICPGDLSRIFNKAEVALAHRVDLLGTRPIELGRTINWHMDYKTGRVWPTRYMRDIDYTNLGEPSDVKVPWEISRLQWLIPAGQAYLLTGSERYAEAVRAVLDDWIAANPYAHGVNWACTMEAALRTLTWSWFFHVFHTSAAWTDPGFRSRFLCALFLHGDFTHRYLEHSDVNGNHCTADAAALVVAGLFWGTGSTAEQWTQTGWHILCEELPRQVYADGVDFESSVAYHRLVLELFYLPARYRELCGMTVPDAYRERLIAMARFTAAYSRSDSSVPLWGDADDGRALPFGGQPINDHRYLMGLVGTSCHVRDLQEEFSGPREEIFWLLGSKAASSLPVTSRPTSRSSVFPHGGVVVFANERDHVFIDCGPVGTAGRGGHGHNDCLGFEVMLNGVHLITDCGAYVYTASVKDRNAFRSTAAHNTPQIDEVEINRFVRPDYLWLLREDARPEVRRVDLGSARDIFCGAHSGYRRLTQPVTPVRTIVLDHASHGLIVHDAFEGDGEHRIEVPVHLAVGVECDRIGPRELALSARGEHFQVFWDSPEDWTLEIGIGRVSPSYGIALESGRLVWWRRGPLESLTVCIVPSRSRIPNPIAWARDQITG